MPLLHDRAVRDPICLRIQTLTSDTPGRWGKMSVDQMLWHVNRVMSNAIGEFEPAEMPNGDSSPQEWRAGYRLAS